MAEAEESAPPVAAVTGLRAQLTKANLFFFGIFLIGIGLVAFMSMRGGPKESSAAEKKQQQETETAITTFLAREEARRKGGPAATPDELMNDTKSLVDSFYNFTAKNQVPLENLRTDNPFLFQRGEPSEAQKKAAELEAQKKRQAEEEARRKRIEKARQDFKELTLQSILNGPTGRQAMVNSSIIRVGDEINGFKVEEIRPRNVLLTREGEEFTLEMTY
jgi:hypothetical protein